MTLKVVCPHCQHAATLKSWKPGTFKPQCGQCKQPFVLRISADEPPKLTIQRLPEAPALPEPPAKKPADLDQTMVPSPTAATVHKEKPATPAAHHPAADKPAINMPANKAAAASKPNQTKIAGTPEVAPKSVISPNRHAAITQPGVDDVTLAPEQTIPVNPDVTLATVDGDSQTARTSPSQVVRSKAHSAGSSRSSVDNANTKSKLPERIGGYKIVDELGRGGMGAVYLARQLSLDRPVALKTIQSQWASDPRVIARFIREAYAAGQLTHNNVVQIYDLGQDGGTNFFSMELVPGGSLSDLIKRQGRLDPTVATAMVLQAARGLKYAHDHGMVHRDIKPANLMLSADGMVKVADLGLVKTPAMGEDEDSGSERSAMLASANASVTGAGSTMGTPAYMSPEQADDATAVDHRADIYSLGCTFYALLTGAPPFQGASAVEVVSKHRSQPLARPETIVHSIPKALGDVVERMTAKSPVDRYQDMSEVIAALEAFLNHQQAKQPLLTDQTLAAELEAGCTAFNREPLAKAKQFIPPVFGLSCLLLSLAASFVHWQTGLAIAIFGISAILGGVLLAMFSPHEAPVAKRLRSLVWLSPWTDWLTWGIGILLFVVAVVVTGIWPYALAAITLGALAAAGYEFVISRALQSRRQPSVAVGEALLKRLRLGGVEEYELQKFVARFAGRQWEDYFIALFDYDTMRAMRRQLAAAGHSLKSHVAPWRDGLVDRLEAKLNQRRQQLDQALLTRVELASLTSQGLSIDAAKQQANQTAQALVTLASLTRGNQDQTLPEQQRGSIEQKRAKFKAMMAEARSGKFSERESLASRASQSLLNHLFGGKYRFALGSLLLVGSLLWAKQNGLFDPEMIDSLRSTATSVNDSLAATINRDATAPAASAGGADVAAGQLAGALQQLGSANPLATATKPFLGVFTNLGQAVIGLLIVLMSLMGGWRVSIATTLGACLVLFGPWFLPSIAILSSNVIAFIASLVVLVVGGYLLRSRELYE